MKPSEYEQLRKTRIQGMRDSLAAMSDTNLELLRQETLSLAHHMNSVPMTVRDRADFEQFIARIKKALGLTDETTETTQ